MPTIAASSTENILAQQRVVDMSEKLAYYDDDATKLLAILFKMPLKKESAHNRSITWREDALLDKNVGANGTVTTTTITTITIDSVGSLVRADDVLLNLRSRELMLAVSANTSTQITVVRGYGTVAAAAINDNDSILVIGNAKREGTGVRDVLMTTETLVENFLQEFSTPVKVNWELTGQKLYGGPERAKQQAKSGIEHLKDIAMSLWRSQKKQDTTNASATTTLPRYATDGIENLLIGSTAFATSGTAPTRLFDSGGTMTESEHENWLRDSRRYNQSGEMWVFGSSTYWAEVNKFARATIRINDQASKRYGLEITDYVIAGLRAHIVEEKIFEDFTAAGGSAQGLSGYAFALDMGKLKYRYEDGFDTKLILDIVKDGTHAYTDEYLTICGLELKLPKAHGLVKGIVST